MDAPIAEHVTPLRRVLRRALIALGGSVAGTAIAWLVSSASAAAEPPSVAGPLDAVAGLAAALTEPVTGAAAQAVEQVVPASPVDPIGPSAARSADVFGVVALADTLDELGVPAPVRLATIDRPIGTLEWAGASRQDASRARPAVAPTGLAPATPASVAIPSSGRASIAPPFVSPGTQHTPRVSARAGGSATERALDEPLTPRGAPVPAVPAPLPESPAGVPVSGGVGHPGGPESPAYAVLPHACGRCGLVRTRTLPAAAVSPAAVPGAQPGVSPD